MLKGKESDRKYTPIIADAKKSLDKAQSEIELGKERICVLNKMVNNLKSKKASMEEITEIIAVWMDTKKTVAVEIREGKRLKERLQLVEEKVEQEVEMRRETHTQQAINGEEECRISKLVAEFRRKKLNVTAETTQASTTDIEPNSNSTDIEPNSNSNSNEINEDPSNSNYNTIIAVPNPITTPQESNTNNNQLSVALLPFLADRQNKNINPAFSVADVAFSKDKSLLLTARDISGHLIQYDEEEISCLVVNLQTASLAPLLNPDTKEITKSESNKMQQVETKRWNTSTKK